MDELEKVRQKIAADAEKQAAYEAEKEAASGEIAALETRIQAAVKAGDVDTAEKLLNEQNAKKTRLEAVERICANALNPQRYLGELISINAERIKEYQAKADKAAGEMEKARRIYLEKKAALAKILYDAAQSRNDCAGLAAIGPHYNNPTFDKFAAVSADRFALELSGKEREEMISGIDPDFLIKVGNINEYCALV